MSPTTPNQIRTLQRKLYVKAEQEPAFRFYALYDKVSRADILSHADDGVTFAAIEAGAVKLPHTAGWTSAHASA